MLRRCFGGAIAFYAYILASGPYGTLYTGSTDNLARRVFEHREKMRSGFTAKYDVTNLVRFEPHEAREHAFRRERQIKEWRRRWKVQLIEQIWTDLYENLPNLIGY